MIHGRSPSCILLTRRGSSRRPRAPCRQRSRTSRRVTMTNAFTDELFPPTPQEYGRIVFPVSWLVCDVERFPEDASEPMAARGMGAVYTATSSGRRLRAGLSPAEHERIMARWYQPHHALLTRSLIKCSPGKAAASSWIATASIPSIAARVQSRPAEDPISASAVIRFTPRLVSPSPLQGQQMTSA
jgi:N-formylglutamate amidohydrolase